MITVAKAGAVCGCAAAACAAAQVAAGSVPKLPRVQRLNLWLKNMGKLPTVSKYAESNKSLFINIGCA